MITAAAIFNNYVMRAWLSQVQKREGEGVRGLGRIVSCKLYIRTQMRTYSILLCIIYTGVPSGGRMNIIYI